MYQVATSDTPENRIRVHSTLLASVLLVPVPEIPEGLGPGVQTAKAPVPVQLTGIVDAHNVRITPAFTDIEALRNWDPNTPYSGIKALELFRLVLTTDIQAIIVNPFDPIRKMIRPGGRVTGSEIEILGRTATEGSTRISGNCGTVLLSDGDRARRESYRNWH
jgi:type III secretion system (T3SS) SseB-like protein